MRNRRVSGQTMRLVGLLLPLCGLLFASGCAKPAATTAVPPGSVADGSDSLAVPPGPRGPGGGGARGAPVAANASGAEIFQAKCQGCHGSTGQGGRGGPALVKASSLDAAALTKIIHDGKGRMPAFGTQLTADQITKVAGRVKEL